MTAPGGRVGIQAITMPHDRMLATRRTYTWINKYVFPGGFLPSVEAIEQITRAHTHCGSVDRLSFGSHYAETLRQWDERFRAARDEVLALGFDETFLRMWHFYLAYSRAGFASGYIDVHQLVLAREESDDGDRVPPHDVHRPAGSPPSWPRRPSLSSAATLPVRLRAWDGTEAGPPDAPLVELRSPDALRRLLWHPGELGAAQAYVTGEVEVARRPCGGADPGFRVRP